MKRRKWIIPTLLIILSVALNIISRVNVTFSNFYVNQIFPIWVETYGRITGLFSFSVGEWMLYLAVILVVFLILVSIFFIFMHKKLPSKYKEGYKLYTRVLYWILAVVCMIQTLNCFLLYQTAPISERYQIGERSKEEYKTEEITILRDYVVEKTNALAAGFTRDENGYIIYHEDMKTEAKNQMKRLSEEFPFLKGYYPNPKELFFSEFYSQQYIMGYYFPFSMEANINRNMYITNTPISMCHELSHLKGIIREDEANFIGYLACVSSEDPMFEYSAYLSVVGYLNWDFFQSLGENEKEYLTHPQLSDEAKLDTQFLTKEAWTVVEEKAVIDTDTVEKATDAFLNTTLTLNGVEDGTVSYSRVVELLLQYYDGILY